MQRPIKFRAWYSGKMVEVGVLEFFTDGSIHVNSELVGCKLMQYTCLKDKNGVEIFEGDVVRLNRNIFQEHKGNYIGNIVWDKNGFGFDNLHFKCDHCEDTELMPGFSHLIIYPYTDCYEVIGNIYQNPELLTTPTPEGGRR